MKKKQTSYTRTQPAVLDSTPRRLARDRRAVTQGAQLGPGDLRMQSRPAAVGAGDDVFAADDVGESDDAIRYQFRVLDEVGGMADDTGDQEFSGGKFHVAPDFEFMFVTDVAGFDQVRLGVDTEHHVDDVAQRDERSLFSDWNPIYLPTLQCVDL